MVIDLRQSFDHIAALLREARDQIYKVAPAMSKAIGQDRPQLLGHIATQGITHLDRWAKTRGPLCKKFAHILPGMVLAGKEQGPAALVSYGKNPCGETPLSRCLAVHLRLLEVCEDLHGGVIAMEEFA